MSEYAGIYLLDNPYFIDNAFDYFLPPDLRDAVAPGDFVTVPFGTANRRTMGLVVSLKNTPDDPTLSCKPVLSVCDRTMSLSDEMMGLCFFIKAQTLCTVGDAVRAAVPASALSHLRELYRAVNLSPTEELEPTLRLVLDTIGAKDGVTLEALKSKFGPATLPSLKKLLAAGLIEKDFSLQSTSEKTETAYALALDVAQIKQILEGVHAAYRLRSTAHVAILSTLCEKWEVGERLFDEKAITDLCGVSAASVKSLCEKGLLKKTRRAIDRSILVETTAHADEICLNDEQMTAFETLRTLSDLGEPRAALLHGVTGSGKTSVMLRTIDHVLSRSKGVIVLLPEIALTPQSLAIFCSRYGDRVAIVHSGLSAGERFDTYRRIKSGRAAVVIGTR